MGGQLCDQGASLRIFVLSATITNRGGRRRSDCWSSCGASLGLWLPIALAVVGYRPLGVEARPDGGREADPKKSPHQMERGWCNRWRNVGWGAYITIAARRPDQGQRVRPAVLQRHAAATAAARKITPTAPSSRLARLDSLAGRAGRGVALRSQASGRGRKRGQHRQPRPMLISASASSPADGLLAQGPMEFFDCLI